ESRRTREHYRGDRQEDGCCLEVGGNPQAVPHTFSDRYTYSHLYSYSDGHPDTNCYTNTHARYRCCGDVEPAAGVDLYFFQRDFYLARRQRHRLLSFRRQFATWRRYLQFRPSDRALENGK